jgi:putative transposase
MEQIARNVTDCDACALRHKRFLIIDRDAVFGPRFKSILGSSGVAVLMTAYQAPNMHAHAERFVRSIRSECLDQMILVGRASLEKAIAEYVAYYYDERSHQGLENEIVSRVPAQREGAIEASERLGGLLKYYHRRAA